MVVLEHSLKNYHKEIDIVTTPTGEEVGMVHCNNCTSEINRFVSLFQQYNKLLKINMSDDEVYSVLFKHSLKGQNDCGNVVVSNYLSGENITNIEKGYPLTASLDNFNFNLANYMKAHLYSAFATLKIGIDIMKREENIKVVKFYAQGGLFKTKDVAQLYLASALDTEISVMKNAEEGGAWGMALLAKYILVDENDLCKYLNENVFKNIKTHSLKPDKNLVIGFEEYINNFKKIIEIERLFNKFSSKNGDKI